MNQGKYMMAGTFHYINGRNLWPVELKAKGESELIYLPCFDIEISKALMRLNVVYLHDCEVIIDSHNLPDRILNIIPDDLTPLNKIDTLNSLTSKLEEMGKYIKHFERLTHFTLKTLNTEKERWIL